MRLRRSCGREDLEQVLLLLDADEQVRGDGVGQLARVLDAHRRQHGVVVQVVRELHVLLEERDDAAHRALDVAGWRPSARHQLHHDPVEALVFLALDRARPVEPLDQHLDVAVGQLEALHDVGHAAHRVDVVRASGLSTGGVVLRGEEDPLALGQRVLERPDGGRPPDDERHHHVREHHDVPQRHDGEGFVHFHVQFGIRNSDSESVRNSECSELARFDCGSRSGRDGRTSVRTPT